MTHVSFNGVLKFTVKNVKLWMSNFPGHCIRHVQYTSVNGY